jgi:hypothetical protein
MSVGEASFVDCAISPLVTRAYTSDALIAVSGIGYL